jgi:protocatechuate 3,4-dioxygenase, beta subunit
MRIEDGLSRRHVLKMSLALAGVSSVGTTALALALPPTESQTMGPFYPNPKPLDQDADLTIVNGKNEVAKGQVIDLMGRVFNPQGKPVPGAKVEIWQANTHGRYDHPNDPNPAPLDPHFQGYAVQFTDAMGRYRFKSIKPGAYPAGRDWIRPPHIHFAITSQRSLLITQMYFPGEALNEKDYLLQDLRSNKDGAIAKLLTAKPTGSLDLLWDIVLDKG